MNQVFIILLSVLFAVIRLTIPHSDPSPSGSYQAFAHLFVGGLIGAWLVLRPLGKRLYSYSPLPGLGFSILSDARFYGFAALALSMWELLVFLLKS